MRLLCFLLLSSALALDQSVTTVRLQDAPGTPVSTSGTASLSEIANDSKLQFSFGDNITTTNVSSKLIVLFVQTLTLRYSNGQIESSTIEEERFFAEELFKPGESFGHGPQSQGRHVVQLRTAPKSTEPSFTCNTLFVQFEDGTTFGDAKYAAHVLDLRAQIWAALAGLIDTYQSGGQSAFLTAINDESRFLSMSMRLSTYTARKWHPRERTG